MIKRALIACLLLALPCRGDLLEGWFHRIASERITELFPLLDGLTAYWAFEDDAANPTVTDSHWSFDGKARLWDSETDISSDQNSEDLNAAGKVNKGFYFDGVGDYVAIDNLSIGQSFTFLIWAKSPTAEWNDFGWLASSRMANGILLHPDKDAKTFRFFVYDSSGNAGSTMGQIGPSDITEWNQYGGAYDFDNKIGYMILNGQKVVTNSVTRSRTAGTINLEIGKDTMAISRRVGHGTVDEAGLWSRVLTAEELKTAYNEGRGITYP